MTMQIDRDPRTRGIAKYPNNPPWNRAVFESRVCPICSFRKTVNSMVCWWCAGQSEPATRGKGHASHRSRVLNALARNHPGYHNGASTLDDEMLIRWGQSLPNNRLLRMRNLGLKGVEWLRSQDLGSTDAADIGSARSYDDGYGDGYRDGINAAAKALRDLGASTE